MRELIKALHVIQEECKKYKEDCYDCPLFSEKEKYCMVTEQPDSWKINDEMQRALL